jgi:hypothetical protein
MFIGKNAGGALSQVFPNMPKKYRRCTKKWTKALKGNQPLEQKIIAQTRAYRALAQGGYGVALWAGDKVLTFVRFFPQIRMCLLIETTRHDERPV